MADCYRCDKKDLRKAFIFEDHAKSERLSHSTTIPLRYLCRDCAKKETEFVRDDLFTQWDQVDEKTSL